MASLENRIIKLETKIGGTDLPNNIEIRRSPDGEIENMIVHGIKPIPGESEHDYRLRKWAHIPTHIWKELLDSISGKSAKLTIKHRPVG